MTDIIFCGQDPACYHNSFLKPITLQDLLDYLSRCFLESFDVHLASELI